MCASLTLFFPSVVVVSKDKILPNYVLEHKQTLAIFVVHSVLANEDVLG